MEGEIMRIELPNGNILVCEGVCPPYVIKPDGTTVVYQFGPPEEVTENGFQRSAIVFVGE